MKLIVTRPEEDADKLSAKLQLLGHEAVIVPLLEILPIAEVTLPSLTFQALCTSSANGLLTTADLSAFHHLPFFAIGPQSAAAARANGFSRVHDKGGNVEGLAREMAKHLKPAEGPVLYLSGSEVTGDLQGKLKGQGFSALRVVVYDAVPRMVEDLPMLMADADGVLLYSPRSAKLWLKQVADFSCDERAKLMTHYCLSANVAAVLPQTYRKIISRSADENAMLTLLDQSNEDA